MNSPDAAKIIPQHVFADVAMKTVAPKRPGQVDLAAVSRQPVVDALPRDAPAEPTSIAAARAALHSAIAPLPSVVRTPTAAISGALSQAFCAAEALPRCATAAMDGYAVAGDGPWRLDTEVRCAGSLDEVILDLGHAVRIATGAHLPSGATAVVRDEHVDVSRIMGGGAPVVRRKSTPLTDDCRRPGEDWMTGALLASAGTTVTPALASLALSAGVSELLVRGPVRGHIVLTGDEIRRDGALRDGQTRDSLGPILPFFLRMCGVETSMDTQLRDTASGFDGLFASGPTAGTADLIVAVGSTGRGVADHLRHALQRAGATLVVDGVRCRPGGSQIVATLPDGRVVLGLPGNPYAAVSTLMLMVPTIVAASTGGSRQAPMTGTITNSTEIASGVTRLVPASRREGGGWHVYGQVRTAHLAALVGRHAIAVIEPGMRDGDPAELLTLSH